MKISLIIDPLLFEEEHLDSIKDLTDKQIQNILSDALYMYAQDKLSQSLKNSNLDSLAASARNAEILRIAASQSCVIERDTDEEDSGIPEYYF